VISERWLARVFARTTENRNKPEQFDKAAIEGEIGPVDNSNLLDPAVSSDELVDLKGEEFVPMRAGLTIGQDFEILPHEAWELIISWYGLKEGTPVIRRYVHNTAVDQLTENLQYEVYPPIFTIRRVRKAVAGTQTPTQLSKPGPKLVASTNDGFVDFLRAAKKAAGIDMKTKVQVWRVLNTAPTQQVAAPAPGMLTPEASPQRGSPVSATPNQAVPLAIDVSDFTALVYGTERELVTGKDETANEKYNGHSSLHIAGLAENQVLILEEQDENGEYLSSSAKPTKSGSQVALNKAVGKTNKALQSNTNSRRSSPARSGPLTRGRTRSGRTRGTVGLINLGNTCYMNSALQCIRSVEELCFYFLSKSAFMYSYTTVLTQPKRTSGKAT
jgi:ubiquitin carboxyl-terminal hydrolase 4/11/15